MLRVVVELELETALGREREGGKIGQGGETRI